MPFSPILAFHVCAGIVGLLSGAVAMSVRKGSPRHRIAGNVFCISMLCMAAVGAYLAFPKSQTNNIVGGVLTFYMVATAWATARRRNAKPGIFDWSALLFALALGTTCIAFGVEGARSPTGTKDGVPAGMNFFLGSIVLLAAAGDIRFLMRGLSSTQRIARHLWRMCFALFIAAGSFFLGQQQVFPAFIRKMNILAIPAVLPLLFLVSWLIRIRFAKAYTTNPTPHPADIYLPT